MTDESTENQAFSSTESDDSAVGEASTIETDSSAAENDSDAFPREYVEKLRKESAGYRAKADEYAKRLHTALVAATDKLQDARDLSYSADHLESAEALSAAIDALLAERPHLKARKVSGDVGQGIHGNSAGTPDFSSLLRRE